MPYEVEQKFPLTDPQRLTAALDAAGVRWEAATPQIDTYFRHPARDFAVTDEALRIRQAGGQTWITYKGPKLDGTTKTRREIELPLPAEIAPARYAELLAALGFEAVAAVRKTRRPGYLDWQGVTLHVALDDVDQLGRFVELELVVDESALDAARDLIREVAGTLGLAGAERRSYLELLLAGVAFRSGDAGRNEG